METKRCPFCAEEILIAAVKCKHCGSSIGVEIPATAPPVTPAAKPTIPRRLLGLAALFGFGLLASRACVALLGALSGSSDEATAIEAVKHILPAPSTAKISNVEIAERGPNGWIHATMHVESIDERGAPFNKDLHLMFRRYDGGTRYEWSKRYALQEIDPDSVSTMKMLNGWGTVEEPAAPTGTK